MKRILAIANRIILQFRRDKRTLGLLVGAPMILLTLTGVLIRASSSTVTLGVVNEDRGALAGKIVQELRGDNTFIIREIARAEMDSALERGIVNAAVLFDADFSRHYSLAGQAEIAIVLEGGNPQNDASAAQKTGGALAQALPRAIAAFTFPGGKMPAPLVNLNYRYVHGGPQFDQLDYFAPAFIAIFVFFLVFLLTTVVFLRERGQGTLERLFATPVSRVELVLGYMVGFGIFALIQSLVVLLFTVFVLRVRIVGNPAIVFLVEALLTIGAINLGIFLSTFARSELQVIQFIPLVITPQALLGDFLFPLETMPAPLQFIGNLMPITYANRALRAVMIRGDGLDMIASHLAVLAGFAVLMIILGATSLRREVA